MMIRGMGGCATNFDNEGIMGKKDKFKTSLIGMVGGALYGVVIGFSMIELEDVFIFNSAVGVLICALLIAVVMYFAAMIIHECGHLVMGLATGYKFVMLRFGSLTIVKQDGKLKIKKFGIPGTGGQCTLTHDEVSDPEKVPYFWYHFGGCFFNFITAAAAILCVLITGNGFLHVVMMNLAGISLVCGILNLIPMNASVINDGMNILRLKNDPKKRAAVLNVLTVNGMQFEGKHLSDIDEKYLDTADENGESPFCDVALIKGARYVYLYEFDKARDIHEVLVNNPKLPAVLKNEALCELMYCRCMLGCAKEEVDELYTKELKYYIRQTENYMIARRRQMYSYYLFYEGDTEKPKRERMKAEQMENSYPCRSEYEEEIRMMNYAEELEKNIKNHLT